MTTHLPVERRAAGFDADAISAARESAADLIERLVLTSGPGEHLVLCVTTPADGLPGLHADLEISRSGDTAELSDAPARRAFGALLMFGRLAREPVGLIMRSCPDAEHEAPGHACVVRGWVVRDGTARPLLQGSVRVLADGGSGPRLRLPPGPGSTIRYESAYSLYSVE